MDTQILSYDNQNVKQIDHVDFDVLGGPEIKRMSAIDDPAGITVTELYDNSEPKKNGLIDPRLGTSRKSVKCLTCGLESDLCPGHPGHIELVVPIFHIGYLQQYVHKILCCVCPACSKLLVYKNEKEFKDTLKTKTGKERLNYVRSLTKNVMFCQKQNSGCGRPVPKIKLELKKSYTGIHLYADIENEGTKDESATKKKTRTVFASDVIYRILKNISDEDCLILGIDPKRTRPENMMLTIFPVPSVQMRPSVHGDFSGGMSTEDDLTKALANIVKGNERLKSAKRKDNKTENETKYFPEHEQVLQYRVISYITNDMTSVPKSEQKGKILTSLEKRLKGKEGRVRGNLMGKRGDFTGRTVITPDPTLNNDQLGVPVKIAMNLTVPEYVRPDNIEKLTKLVRNGRDKYPGANFVFIGSNIIHGKQNHPIDLRYRKKKIELKYGDIVERHLQNGDIVLLNRQPTLHKLSMMGHRVKVINNTDLSTFRLSVANCSPYNADFDGDEMNIFVWQNDSSRIELEEIACVDRQLILPSDSTAAINLVQDGLIGVYNITASDTEIDWRNAMNLISYSSFNDFGKMEKRIYSGRELFSLIIPKRINIRADNFKIKNGVIDGQMTSGNSFGGNSIIKLVWDEYGIGQTTTFINDMQRITNNFNLYNGFSLGIGDLFTIPEVDEKVRNLIATKAIKVEHMISDAENHPYLMDIDMYEKRIFEEFENIVSEVAGIIVNNAKPKNGILTSVFSGAKGDKLKVGQMSGCVGMQAFEGNIIQKKLNHRTSPYFHRDDDRPIARGFANNSYLSGLNFPEYVIDAYVGREGVVEQAVKTAVSGYMQHKMIKMLEDVSVKYDMTVRTANESVIQLYYGNSGVDTTKQYNYKFELFDQKMNNTEIKNLLLFKQDELRYYSDAENNDYVNKIIGIRNTLFIDISKATMDHIVFDTKMKIPVGLDRIIDNIANDNTITGDNLEPRYVLEQIDKLLTNEITILTILDKVDSENPHSIKKMDGKIHKTLFEFALHDALNPRRSIVRRKLNKMQFDKIIDEIANNFNKNIVEPGEAVGIIAGQSTGQPLTQMVLNSIDYTEIIDILDYGKQSHKIIEIGKLVDRVMENNKGGVVQIKEDKKESKGIGYYIGTSDFKYYIQSVVPNGRIAWKKIIAMTKHIVVNADGSNKIICITTRSGRKLTGTKGKSFLTRINNNITDIRGDNLTVGMFVPIDKSRLTFEESTKLFKNDKIPGNRFIGLQEIEEKMNLLKLTETKNIDKCLKKHIDEIINSDVVYDEIIKIDEIEPTHEYVYDLTIEDTKTFCIANGMCCMDTFHNAGIKAKSNTVQGMPRISELISVSKKQKSPQMNVYLIDEYSKNIELAHKIASNLKYTSLGDISERVEIYYDPEPNESGSLMEQDNIKNSFYCDNSNDSNDLPLVMRIEINKEKMLGNEVTMIDIKSKLCDWWEKRFNENKTIKKESKKVINKITKIGVLSNLDSDKVPIIHIRFNGRDNEDDKFNLETMNDFIVYIIDNIKLKGIDNITDCDPITDQQILKLNKTTGEIISDKENFVITYGSDLINIRYLIGIDLNRTITNDIVHAYKVFGIEIARQVLLHELMEAYKNAGAKLNYQHIELLVDMMTCSGTIMSIDRHGISKTDGDALTRASFETTVEQLTNAAVFGETEHMKGVSARIMAGQIINCGTGCCDVYLDTETIEKSEYQEGFDTTNKFEGIDKPVIAQDIVNQKVDEMFIP